MSTRKPPPKGRPKPPPRTVTLPASLRAELVELGHLPAAGKGKLGRKEKRKAARDGGKAARAKHFAGKKRKAEEVEQAEESEEEEIVEKPIVKKKKVLEKSVEPVKKTTALERLLAKQEGGNEGIVDPKRKKNNVESTEDREIAWLEAKLGVRGGPTPTEKGKWNEEITDDGLDDLFAGIDELETAAFGTSYKDYAKLQRADDAQYESNSEFDEGEAVDDASDSEMEEYGIDDDELVNPSLDDDDDEDDDSEDEEQGMLSEWESDGEGGGMEITFGADEFDPAPLPHSDADSDDNSEEEEETLPEKGKKGVRFQEETAVASTSTLPPTRYIPPHLRKAATTTPSVSAFVPEPTTAPTQEEPPEDPRLRRQIMGLLNKLSSSNLPSILAAIAEMYTTNPRALVSHTLTSLLLEIISGRDNLGEQFVITYAALVAALTRSVGVEFPAGVLARCVGMFDVAHAKNIAARSSKSSKAKEESEEGGFEGRPGSKECENLVAFLAELYNFDVVACVLIYDLVKLFIDSGLGELEVELLVKIVKRSGQQLRQDDPSSLKEIITLIKAKMDGIDASTMNSRTRFMVEALTNLKNNKIKATGDGLIDNYSNLKKFLAGLKKRSGSTPDALRLSLADIRSSSSKGKWWIVGAAWGGDPLVDNSTALKNAGGLHSGESESDQVLARLAKKQGMNTDVRKGIFNVLMSSEDYVDACERLLQLGLTDIQQREIARILLQCSGNEKVYNPYYTLVAFRMATKSHSFQITLQYCLWDFLRELGEKTVGGEEMVKGITDDGGVAKSVSSRRVGNLARLYAWCVAKDALSLTILKPVPFLRPKVQTVAFLQQFFSALLISTQCVSPALILNPTTTRKDSTAIEKVFIKTAPHPSLVKGVSYFFETAMEDVIDSTRGEKGKVMLKFGIKIALGTLGVGVGNVVDY